jgi:hypothetical protein
VYDFNDTYEFENLYDKNIQYAFDLRCSQLAKDVTGEDIEGILEL